MTEFPIREFHIHLYGPATSDRRDRRTPPIPTSFESAMERLQTDLSRVLLEPDGSLAWAGQDFRLVGMLYDAASQIQYVELRGTCRRHQLRRLVETVAGFREIDDFAVMELPQRQWKDFQSFANQLPE
ncbi:hypothetical protein FYK55_19570 [Roseiconus nitratireducens]|uniref:Uncharacterized protein n=1 Tax=Roseiconus nitratireducens TaxID=2605748 RepID=A0A5M6D0W6_9BACT|nr:hypothetical protein [Roseiconus nitratireducens]KAA5541094.1 hypothetical protein FYK55_19570 [Roseiconus nitratireducens]